MIQIAPIAPIGVSIPFQNRNKLQPWRTRKNGDNLAVFVSKKPGRFGNCRCQKTDRLNDIIGKEINGPVDMVAAEMNANNVLVDRIVADQAERKPRAGTNEKENHIEKEAWNLLRSAVVDYCGSPIGTIAANDPTDPSMLNYDQVFIRDFIPSGVAFLLKGEHDIVRNFILHTLQLQVLGMFHKCMLFYSSLASIFMLNAHVQNVKFVIKPKKGENHSNCIPYMGAVVLDFCNRTRGMWRVLGKSDLVSIWIRSHPVFVNLDGVC